MNTKLNNPKILVEILKKTIVLGIVAIFVIMLFYFVWALDRGFEMSDESFYLLLAINPFDTKVYLSAMHWESSLIWNITGSLAAFRLFGLCLLLFSALVLTFGVFHSIILFKARKLNNWEKLFILCSTLTSALIYGAYINFSPCYNLFAASGSYLALGLAFYTISNSCFWCKNLFFFLTGGAIGIILISKASAGISVFCLTSVLTIFYQKTFLQKLISILITISGIILIVVLLSLPYWPLNNILQEMRLGLITFKSAVQDEPTLLRINRYFHEFVNQHLYSGLFLVVPIFLFSKIVKPYYLSLLVFGSIIYIFFMTTNGISYNLIGHWPNETYKMYAVTSAYLTAIFAISLILGISNWTKNIDVFIFSSALFLLPYAFANGTGNSIQTQVAMLCASWTVLITFIAVSDEISTLKKMCFYFLTFTFLAVISYQVVQSSSKPYCLDSSIWDQSIPTKIGRLGIVKVDKKTHDFVEKLKFISNNCLIPKNKDYLGFYAMPGVALVIEAIPYGTPWLANYKHAELILDKSSPTILKESIIGISSHDKLPKQLSKFPKGYTKCGEATYPFMNQVIQIWKPIKK